MSGRVIVVGSVNVDLVVRAARLPSVGETVTGGTFERHHGGKGGNQAVAASRLGSRRCSSARWATTRSG
jgi:ribokinase